MPNTAFTPQVRLVHPGDSQRRWWTLPLSLTCLRCSRGQLFRLFALTKPILLCLLVPHRRVRGDQYTKWLVALSSVIF